jgi:hypothetical protein
MSETSDDRKEPYDSVPSPVDDKVTGRTAKRRSRSSRRSTSAVSTPLKSVLDKERSEADDKIKRYFERRVIHDHFTGQAGYKTRAPVKIDGITYSKGDFVPLDVVEAWGNSRDDGVPPPDRDSDAEDFRDSGDPDDISSSVYPSPLGTNDPYWCYSEENRGLIAAAIKPKFIVPEGDIFEPPIKGVNSISYQALKEKFEYSNTSPFKFNKVSYAAIREIQDAVVAHIRKTTRADQEYSLYETFKIEFRQDLVVRLRTHKEYASMAINSHRRDGFYLETEISEHFLSQLQPKYMLPLLLIAILPLIETAGRASHESVMISILRYESKRFMLTHSIYFSDRISLFQNFTKVHHGIKAMTAEIIKFSKITEWWMGKWYPVKSYNTNITSWTELLKDAFDSTNTPLTLHDLYSLWTVGDRKYRHFSHMLRDKLLASAKMELDLQPASGHLMKLDGILDKRTSKPSYHHRGSASPSSGRSASSGTTTASSNSSVASTSSNTSSLTTNNISHAVDQVLSSVNAMTMQHQPKSAIPNRPTVSFHKTVEDRPTPVCFVQLVKGICNKPECEKTFSHDEARLNKTRSDLVRQWSAGSTLGASKANLNLVQQLNISMSDDDDLQDVQAFLGNLEADIDLIHDAVDQEENQE